MVPIFAIPAIITIQLHVVPNYTPLSLLPDIFVLLLGIPVSCDMAQEGQTGFLNGPSHEMKDRTLIYRTYLESSR